MITAFYCDRVGVRSRERTRDHNVLRAGPRRFLLPTAVGVRSREETQAENVLRFAPERSMSNVSERLSFDAKIAAMNHGSAR